MRRKILYIQYTNPAGYPSLEHSSRILAREGWQAAFIGTGAHGADSLHFPPHDQIKVIQVPFCQAGWRQKLHYVRFTLRALSWGFRWRPSRIYASDPLSCPIALLLRFFVRNSRVVYHEHDWPAATPNSSFMRSCLRSRKWLAREAELCILPNQERARLFALEMGSAKNIVCVWNCPSQEEISPGRASHNGDALCVLYHGSLVPSRLPPTVIRAMTLVPKAVNLRVIGYETIGFRGYLKRLQEMSKELGVHARVEFLRAVPTRSELLTWCRRSDVGMAFMPKSSTDLNERTMVGASNKPFDYLACGLALLVADLPEWRRTYLEPGYGLACEPDDPESIAAALLWFLEHPAEMRVMGERGRQRVSAEWNYETQFAPVLRHISDRSQ